MALWRMTRVSGRPVAVRIRHPDDRGRRVVRDENEPDDVREEWRCIRCREWITRDAVTLHESGRVVAGAPEISVYCASCRESPRLRGAP